MYYKLDDDHQVVPASLDEFSTMSESIEKRRVASTHLCDGRKWVSTVFLGLDHRFGGEGMPIVFETMVFDVDENGKTDFSERYTNRYCTWEEAEAGHKRVVERLEKGLPLGEEE